MRQQSQSRRLPHHTPTPKLLSSQWVAAIQPGVLWPTQADSEDASAPGAGEWPLHKDSLPGLQVGHAHFLPGRARKWAES